MHHLLKEPNMSAFAKIFRMSQGAFDDEDIVLVAPKRTPIGAFQGALASHNAPDLAGRSLRGTLTQVAAESQGKFHADKEIDTVVVGHVLGGGLGQHPGRQAAMQCEDIIGKDVDTMTINKMCGSGMKAVQIATALVQSGQNSTVACVGMENMSQAPYVLQKARTGYRLGHGELTDTCIKDGLWDVYTDKHMGSLAELLPPKYDGKLSREEQDKYAIESYKKAQKAQETGAFKAEIVPVGDVTADEEPQRAKFEKFPNLRPAFDRQNGTITPANASSINDGAASLLVTSGAKAREWGVTPVARVLSVASAGRESEFFTLAPVMAIQKALEKANLKVDDIGLWEINEAFSVVPMACSIDLHIPMDRINVNGGAVALGHPIGCSGIRILVTLLHAMRARNVKRGCAAICIGGGEGTAIIVELP